MNEPIMIGGTSALVGNTTSPRAVSQEKMNRIAEAEKFFNLMFCAVKERKFGYLWTKQDKASYPFIVSNADERALMAKQAIELSDSGFDVYFGVNLMDTSPTKHARVKSESVTVQMATVTDIDILGGEHKDPAKYPSSFEIARGFLPFTVSILVNSGYGLHGYALYSEPIMVTTDNRNQLTDRNKKFLKAIRMRADKFSKAVDSVHDLPRVLRVPGTYNYKCGRENAPLCHLVEVNDLRFSPKEFDEKLREIPAKKLNQGARGAVFIYQSTDSHDFDIWRATKMLEIIPVAALSRYEWLNIGMALKNNGNSVSDWEQWSRPDARFKTGECEKLWQGFTGTGLTIATICDIANRYGYDAKETYREWKTLQKEFLSINDNKSSKDFQPPTDHQPGTNSPPNEIPTPDKVSPDKNYFSTMTVAKIIGVTKQAVEKWRKKGWFNPDMIDHKGVYYYEVERVMQLKSVYRPDWETAWTGDPTPPMDNNAQKKFSWTQEMIKSCPVNLRLPDNYLFNHKGITLVVPPKKDGDNPKYVCAARTPIIPTKIFREPKQNTFTYEIATLIRGVWRTTEIAGRALADPRAIITLADSGALIDEPKLICRFINAVISLNPDLQEIKAYDQPGWHDGKFIYPTGGKDYVVRRAGFNYSEEFATRGDADTLKNAFLDACQKGGAVARLYLGTGLLSTLIQPLNILNAQIQLNSKSGGGKTALAKLAAALFGNPRELIRTFGATEKNRQAVAAAYNDLPNFFDEMETMSGKRAEEQLSQMIYSYAEGKGNQAQKRDGTARQAFRFYGARLMTAERPILKEHDLRGAYKRLVQIRCPKLFEDQFAADLHFIAENNFGHFGKSWTEFVPARLKEIREILSGFGKIFAQNPQNIEPTQLKTVTSAFVALQYFLICVGAQAAFDDVAAARDIKEIIKLLPTNAEIDDTTRALASLSSYVASHEKSFMRDETSNETGKPVEIGSWGTVCSGKIFDTGEVIFFPTELKRILEDELHFASADKLIAEWKEQGNILITDKGRTTHTIRLGGKTPRVFHFRANIITTNTDSAETQYYAELGAL